MTAAAPAGLRRLERGGVLIEATMLRGFARAALDHQAAHDQVNDLHYDHVVHGRSHPSVVAASLHQLPADLLAAMTADDWQSVADQLIADARATLQHPPSVETELRGG